MTKMTAVLRDGERVPNWMAMKAIALIVTVSLGLGGWALVAVSDGKVKQAEDHAVIGEMKEGMRRIERKLDRALEKREGDF